MSADAVNGVTWSPQSWNRYSYVKGNPIQYNDPLGLLPIAPITGGVNPSDPQACANMPGGCSHYPKGTTPYHQAEVAQLAGCGVLCSDGGGGAGQTVDIADQDGATAALTQAAQAIFSGKWGTALRLLLSGLHLNFLGGDRGLDTIFANHETFERWLDHKFPVDQPFDADDSQTIWDKLESEGLKPRLDPPQGKWGPHINLEREGYKSVHIPVDPDWSPIEPE